MNIVYFRPEHLKRLSLQNAQQYFGQQLTDPDYGRVLLDAGPCFTGMRGDEVIICAGVFEVWENRAMAWALLSKNAAANMLAIHKAVRGYLLQAPYRRIEATVDAGFEDGRRWAEMLGFVQETPEPMRAFLPNGGDCYLYARVK
jgi:hypothetical protein